MKTLFGWANLSLDDKLNPMHRPVNKTIVVGDLDPRRQTYFPDVEPGVELHLPGPGRFALDLFFIAPFYHRLLPRLDQVIVIDLDLEFRWDNKSWLRPTKTGLGWVNCKASSHTSTKTNSWVLSATSPHIIHLSPLVRAHHGRQESGYGKQTWISGCQRWSDAVSTGQDASIRRVQRRAETRLDDPIEQNISSASRMESRCSRLVLPPLLGQASSPCSSALSIQCDAVHHRLILKCSKVRQLSLRPGDKSCTFLWKWNKLIGWRGVHTLPLSYHLTLCYSNGLLNSHEIKWKRTSKCLSAILHTSTAVLNQWNMRFGHYS